MSESNPPVSKTALMAGCFLKLSLLVVVVVAAFVFWRKFTGGSANDVSELRNNDVIYIVNATSGRWLIDELVRPPEGQATFDGRGPIEGDYGRLAESRHAWGAPNKARDAATAWTVKELRETHNGQGISFQLVSSTKRRLVASPIRFGPPEMRDKPPKGAKKRAKIRKSDWGIGWLPTTSSWTDTVALLWLDPGTRRLDAGKQVLTFEIMKGNVLSFNAKKGFSFAAFRGKQIPSYRISVGNGGTRQYLDSKRRGSLPGSLPVVKLDSFADPRKTPNQWYFIRVPKGEAP